MGEQGADLVQIHPGPGTAKIMRFHDEWRCLAHFIGVSQPAAQGIVHHHLERTAAALGSGLEVGSNVGVEGEGSSHIVMLSTRHHDVYF